MDAENHRRIFIYTSVNFILKKKLAYLLIKQKNAMSDIKVYDYIMEFLS